MKQAFFSQPGWPLVYASRWPLVNEPVQCAVLNTSGVYVEALTLVPGEGSGQHSTIPGEVGIVAEGRGGSLEPGWTRVSSGGQGLFWLPGLTLTIFAMKAIGPQRST